MAVSPVMKRLEALGTAQNRKVYARHGDVEPLFGVSFANLRKLGKELGTDSELASELWDGGNHDARVLATLIADPRETSASRLDGWARDLRNYVVTDAFAGLVSRTRHARSRAEKWARSKDEWIGRAGWTLVAHLAMAGDDLSDDYFEDRLATIEREIHARKNGTRYAMNSALIAIGGRNAALRKKALAAAKRIGTVHVDHGETGCKTPDAALYIVKMADHRRSKAGASR